VLVQEVSILQH